MPDICRRAVVDVFPELANAQFSVAGKGWDSLAVEAEGLIFKFPGGETAAAALRREVRLLAVVRPHLHLPVPAMTLHEGPPPFSRHEKLPGEALDRAGYLLLSETQRQRLAGDLARFFADLHAISPETMRQAGAERVEWWDTRPATLQPVWEALPADVRPAARNAIVAYRRMPNESADEVYGFFDAHGWNMAFDHQDGRLEGIFDFADSGLGPREREFVQVSLVHPELAVRAMAAYERISGRRMDRRKVYLLAAAQRLSEFAGALESGENHDLAKGFAVDWFRQDDIAG